jgi:GGDEF domain-containing protein
LFADQINLQDHANHVADRILNKLQIQIPSQDGIIKVGATLGLATCPADATEAEGMITLADRLLYIGKKSGRNRVITAKELNGRP